MNEKSCGEKSPYFALRRKLPPDTVFVLLQCSTVSMVTQSSIETILLQYKNTAATL